MKLKQTVLKFKLEITKDIITAHAGLAVLGEFAVGMKIQEMFDKEMPVPGSGAGYSASEHIYPLILMLNGGGRSLEDLREIKNDNGLREILPLKRIPSSDAVGDFLRRSGKNGGLEGLGRVNRQILKQGLKKEKTDGYTLDIDATGIEAEKALAAMTYKGFFGYMPITGHLGENGLIIGEEFRNGNDSPASRNLEFLKHCISQMPKGKHIKAFRADSASYQAGIINYCHDNRIEFAIGGDLDKSVISAIEKTNNWKKYENGYISETIHCMNKTLQAFRLIIIKRPYQTELLNESKASDKYTVIASNRTETPEEIVKWYNQRGQCSENRIKELKIGFGMERMPCGQFEANAVFFRIGAIAYNIGRLFALNALESSWHRRQVQTLRWKLYNTAGKIIFHGREVYLKVRRHLYGLFSMIRSKTWEYASS